MSEFSIEEKANAYDIALKKAKTLLSKCKRVSDKASMIYRAEDIESMFPELKESEDDRIRKELINFVKSRLAGFPQCEKYIFWLEKQSEQGNNEDETILHRFSFYSYKDEPNILYLAGLYVNDEYRNKGIGTKILKIADEVAVSMKCSSILLKTEIGSNAERLYKNNGYSVFRREENQVWLEKQGKETSEKEFTFKSLPRLLEMIEVSDRAKAYTEKLAVTLDNEGYHTDAKIVKERIKIMNGEEVPMATMDEQEPIDKIEPKFNLYDWVVTDKGDVVQIGAVNNGYYTLLNGMDFNMSYVDKCWHLWTNQDIKDGDILCGYPKTDYPWIGIFHNLNTDGTFNSYCFLQAGQHGKFCPPSEENIFGKRNIDNHILEDIVPATKEQRDLLFAKIKEAGFKWNKNKKILKRL